MEALFRFLATWPLGALHALGAALGWLTYALSGRYRAHFRAHAAQAGYAPAQVRAAVAHAGRMAAELPRLWLGAPVPTQWDGKALIDAAHAAGRGIIFLTPHLGCFEVAAQAYAKDYNAQGKTITVLFRPARKLWLRELVAQSRSRPGLAAAPATLAGVKALVKALRQGQTLGILPDQVPPQGLGVWASFFGKQAYTMTLHARLALQTGATVLLVWGERLPAGQGYCVHVRPFPEPLSADLTIAATQVNAAMEQLVRECPQQYLWAYARYKPPRAELASASNAGAAS
jgi:Kdo2-lipid IVA lauroyltransferase/acyltransferase